MEIEEIKLLLQKEKISYPKLSEMSGVTLGTLKEIFRGRIKHPRIDTMQAIEQALGIREYKEAPTPQFSPEEIKLIEMYRKLDDGNKKMVFGYAENAVRAIRPMQKDVKYIG